MPTVVRWQPVVRGEGKLHSGILPVAQWIDCLQLDAGVPQSYTPPKGEDPAGGVGFPPPGAPVTATLFLVTNAIASPLFINPMATASIPTMTVLTGAASLIIPAGQSRFLQIPFSYESLNFVCAASGLVSIEAWW